MRKWTLGLMLMMLAGAATGNTPEKVVLDAANMTCPACSIKIEKALEKVPGVTGTQVDNKTATMTVTFDSELTNIPAEARAITEVGITDTARAPRRCRHSEERPTGNGGVRTGSSLWCPVN